MEGALYVNNFVKVFVRTINSDINSPNYLDELNKLIYELLNSLDSQKLLGDSEEVYIKPNGIDTKPYSYTRPEVVEAVINYCKDFGTKKIFLMESSTQANYTRIVFEVLGYNKICGKTGVKPIYLDEKKTITLEFKGKQSSSLDPDGYDKTTFRMPKIVVDKLITNKEKNLYINLPKLKTHSMGVVTLGIKNQWCFPAHADRTFDHNFNLHHKLVDVLEYIQPDITLIDGVEGVIHGHYPTEAFHERVIKPFKILIASNNVLAADIVGTKIFGISPDEVPSLKIAIERKLCDGIQGMKDIQLDGDLSRFNKKYDFDIIQEFPPNVNIIKGKELVCREGCLNNPLVLTQTLYFDYNGKGKCDLVLGKGHDLEIIDGLAGPVVVAGKCAVEEVGQRLIKRLGKRNVYLSDSCNNLAQTIIGLSRFMGVNLLKLVPINPIKSLLLIMQAKFHRSNANVPTIPSMMKSYKVKY